MSTIRTPIRLTIVFVVVSTKFLQRNVTSVKTIWLALPETILPLLFVIVIEWIEPLCVDTANSFCTI